MENKEYIIFFFLIVSLAVKIKTGEDAEAYVSISDNVVICYTIFMLIIVIHLGLKGY